MAKNKITEQFKKSKFEEVLKKVNVLDKFTDKKEEPQKKKKVLLFKAEVLIRDSKFPAALKVLDEVLGLDANDIAANYQKGLCLFVLRRNKEGLSYVDAAIEENQKLGNPENFNFVILKAGILYGLGVEGKMSKNAYRLWLEKAKEIDLVRAEKFMKNNFKEYKETVDMLKR